MIRSSTSAPLPPTTKAPQGAQPASPGVQGQPEAGTAGTGRRAAVPVSQVVPPVGGFKAAQSLGQASPQPRHQPLADKNAATLSLSSGGGKSNTDLLRPRVSEVFAKKFERQVDKDDFAYISMKTHLTDLAESVAALKDQQLAPASANQAKKELFIQLAREKFADHPEQVKASAEVHSLEKFKSVLEQEVDGNSTAHTRSSAAAIEHYNVILRLRELPANIRSAKEDCVDFIAEQAISKALRQAG
jgi:hypothetical protein